MELIARDVSSATGPRHSSHMPKRHASIRRVVLGGKSCIAGALLCGRLHAIYYSIYYNSESESDVQGSSAKPAPTYFYASF